MRGVDPFGHLSTPSEFRCIVADPPWQTDDHYGRRGARAKYKTLPLEKIQWHYPYRELVMAPRNCVLFLWRLSSMQPEALALIESWGFVVKSELVWEKVTKHGKPHFGNGHYVRAAHETCLIATRGRVQVKHHSQRSRFSARVGRHSEKPDEFYRIVERLVPGPRLELFARRERPGWVCLGNQLPKLRLVTPSTLTPPPMAAVHPTLQNMRAASRRRAS